MSGGGVQAGNDTFTERVGKMKLFKATGNNTTQRIYLKGDKQAEQEPEEFYIHFPGGSIGVCRCDDGSYWAHLCRKGKAVGFDDARVDCRELHTGEMNIGDLARPDCYHVAVKVCKA